MRSLNRVLSLRKGYEKRRLGLTPNQKLPLCKKVGAFKSRCTKPAWRSFSSKIKVLQEASIKGAKGHSPEWRVNVSSQYTCADVVEKIGAKPVCYLTGVKDQR